MSRFLYYEKLKTIARKLRADHGLRTPHVSTADLRRIYNFYNIQIDRWPYKFKDLRGAYFSDDLGATVMVPASLPTTPYMFTLAHELKHHLVDEGLPVAYCETRIRPEPIEIGAEVFAAELMFPDEDFERALEDMGVAKGRCSPKMVVQLKHKVKATLSYTGLAKKAEFLGFAPKGAFANIRWKKLEEELFGEPLYKRIRRYKQRSRNLRLS